MFEHFFNVHWQRIETDDCIYRNTIQLTSYIKFYDTKGTDFDLEGIQFKILVILRVMVRVVVVVLIQLIKLSFLYSVIFNK